THSHINLRSVPTHPEPRPLGEQLPCHRLGAPVGHRGTARAKRVSRGGQGRKHHAEAFRVAAAAADPPAESMATCHPNDTPRTPLNAASAAGANESGSAKSSDREAPDMKIAKGAVLNGMKEAVSVEPVGVGAPRPGEFLVRIAAAGVCHSDLPVINGDIPQPIPCVLGHEGAGVVEEVGPGVTRVAPGDHVVLNWVPYCGSCWYCTSGHMYLCEAGFVKAMTSEAISRNGSGIGQMAGVGTMAELALVSENSCIPLDP